MKIALVHELLTIRGGAERVLRIFADMFPEAPIYTLLYNEKKLGDWFPKERVRTAHFPIPYPLFPSPLKYNHHLHLPRFPKAIESWDFSDFDLVISTSSAFAHGIITNSAPKHLSYINSPARYLWDRTHDVLERAGHGLLGPVKRRYLERTFHKLRTWDAESADRPDKLIAASKEVQRRIELYWRRESELVYPPINDFWLKPETRNQQQETRSYYFVASTLVPYKRIDLAIESCKTLKVPLKIAGEGPDRRRLQKLAGSSVEFLGYTSQDKLKKLYTNAKAILFPGDEDFGLVPLESMACGTPVIAFRSGGALETITEGETGEFFEKPTGKSLAEALLKMENRQYSEESCQAQAQKFSRATFEQNIRQALSTI